MKSRHAAFGDRRYLRQHPVSFLRAELQRLGAAPCARLPELRPGQRITVAGIVLVRQRPGSAKGVMFATVEDETGHANIIVWPNVFERQRRIVLSARMIACRGRPMAASAMPAL